jgi:hypothetical protein
MFFYVFYNMFYLAAIPSRLLITMIREDKESYLGKNDSNVFLGWLWAVGAPKPSMFLAGSRIHLVDVIQCRRSVCFRRVPMC